MDNVETRSATKSIHVVDPSDCSSDERSVTTEYHCQKELKHVETQSTDLELLVLVGRKQGYLTYDQVNEYLPDEANTAEKLDQLFDRLRTRRSEYR